VISDAQIAGYCRDGFIVVEDLVLPSDLSTVRQVIAELVDGAAAIDTHTAVYDLEPGHTRADPKVRRIKAPHKLHTIFDSLVRSAPVMDVLRRLIGPDLRLHNSKLNMKSAGYGSPVEWHQDWAFYPHTNDDLLAIGVMLDDMDTDNGPLLVSPGTHKGPVWNHHGEDGRFTGMINPSDIAREIGAAVALNGRAGSMSFHHVRALHGSALNASSRSRNLLLYEVAAADAWPLLGVLDFDEFNSRLLSGEASVEPRLAPIPVRVPFPPAVRQGSIYENQASATKTYFKKTAA
jgi:ectoine hydroxylase-related dioxygenase (phytanoyl-CoA dioxygenase family)